MKNAILGVETSCDETALALYDGQNLEQVVLTQTLHEQYGGVVPEVASRIHLEMLPPLFHELCDRVGWNPARLDSTQIQGIAYTHGPGLLGALLMGATFAKTLGWALRIPTLGIHHLEGHLAAPQLAPNPPPYPHLALLVSGGHTQLIAVRAFGAYEILGESIDDAAGEAFDKTAKLLDLPYPGGALLSQLALNGDPHRFPLSKPLMGKPGLDFSFSGLKTQIRQVIERQGPDLSAAIKADLAASFEYTVVETLLGKIKRALDVFPCDDLVLSGGVAANQRLRHSAQQFMASRGGKAYFPPIPLCTDNAAMIAYAGWIRMTGSQPEQDPTVEIKVYARLPLLASQ